MVSLPVSKHSLCPQVEPLIPTAHARLSTTLDTYLSSDDGERWAIESLSLAVRIPTQIFDDFGLPGEDPRWEIMLDMHEFLRKRFPLVHRKLTVHKVNQYGLVYIWRGSDDSLKPLVLTAHMDVVPVNPETRCEWRQPPFSGFYDGNSIWGRGSADDKAMLVGTMSAVELLLQKSYEPRRSVVLAYGYDEERGGRNGARSIGQFLVNLYGQNGAAMLIDEGGQYFIHDDIVMAVPNVAEKGAMNVQIEVATPGGHSSVPPVHTGIGYLSRIVAALEDNSFPASLKRDSTYFRSLRCEAAYDDSYSDELRGYLARASVDDAALVEAEKALRRLDEDLFRAFAGTTQAVDVISGGIKNNALPERAHAIVNHRIAEDSSVAETAAHYAHVLAPLAMKLNLTLDSFGKMYGGEDPANGHITVSTIRRGLNPAPVTPTEGSGAWEVLSGTILSSLGTSVRAELSGKRIVVAPGIMIANSDTKWYRRLTKNIFRYGHIGKTDRNGMHTTNEAIKAEGYIEGIRFYARLILNVDESDLL
ncbi:carboxypeptidase S [Peniophora sp. CONT]|nr:carboxypeptidase S [Peniophora sp. CONT]